MAAVGRLELDPAERVEWLFAGPWTGAEDEHAGLVVRLSGDVPHGER